VLFKVKLYESKIEKKKFETYLDTFLFSEYPSIQRTNTYLNYMGDLGNKKNIWPDIVSSIKAIANGEQISNPGWKKIINNYEYHVRGAYKVVYSKNKNGMITLKAIGHSANVMPVMNSL